MNRAYGILMTINSYKKKDFNQKSRSIPCQVKIMPVRLFFLDRPSRGRHSSKCFGRLGAMMDLGNRELNIRQSLTRVFDSTRLPQLKMINSIAIFILERLLGVHRAGFLLYVFYCLSTETVGNQ